MKLAPYFPDSAQINNNILEIGGCNLKEIAQKFGTPLYIIDETTLLNAINKYKSALKEFYPNSQVLFAGKALCLKAIFSILNKQEIGVDVVSEGELYTAQSINFPAEKIYFHGNNKSLKELQKACLYKTKIVLDNFDEIDRLISLNTPAKVLLRVTPGIECHTHEYIKTGHLDSKFGFDLEQLDSALQKLLEHRHIEILGLHAHIGSQIFEIQPYEDEAKILMNLYADIKRKYNLEFEELDIGGGIGIYYTEKDEPPCIREVIERITNSIKENVKILNLKLPKLILEPGRSLVGRAGITLYTVGSSKKIPEGKHYIAVDGGMADNPRSITYGAKYSCVSIEDPLKQEEQITYCLAGRFCESGDVLIKEVELPKNLKQGDLLVIFSTGAYNYSMSSNYNRVAKPAMILVKDGQADLILKRENLEDLLRNDLLPERLR